jgi:predicted phage-related endonuclease
MSVMGWPRVDLAVLLYGRLKIYPVERNDKLIGSIESAAKEMSERVANDDPPEPDWNHPQTPQLIKELHGLRDGLAVELPQECEAFWVAYQGLGDDIRQREKERDSIKARLLHAMGEAAIGQLPGIGMEVVRSTVERGEYTVKASSYITFRGRKART